MLVNSKLGVNFRINKKKSTYHYSSILENIPLGDGGSRREKIKVCVVQ